MKKRLLALVLTLAAVLSLLPVTALPAAAASSIDAPTVKLVRTFKDGFNNHFVYEWNGMEIRSCDVGPATNFKAWQLMNDADKREALHPLFNLARKQETLGEEGAVAAVAFINDVTGWTKAIEKFRWKVEKRYNDPELVHAFSDHVPSGYDAEGNANTMSWYERTMAEQFTPTDEMNKYFGYYYVSNISILGKQDIKAAQAAMEAGHQFYQALNKYHQMAMDIAVKTGSKEIIGIMLDRYMFPCAPTGMASALAGATGSLANELANIYLQVSGLQSEMTEALYGEQPDPSVSLKYVNAMADLMEVGCKKALAGARSCWATAERHLAEMKTITAQYNADHEAYLARKEAEAAAAANPSFQPDTSLESTVTSVVKPLEPGRAPMKNDDRYKQEPDRNNNYSDFNQALYDSDRRSYQSYLYSEASKWKTKRDNLLQIYDTLEEEYTTWTEQQEDNIVALLNDGVPSYSGAYDNNWDWDQWYSQPDLSTEEMHLRENTVQSMGAYISALKSYAQNHASRAQSLYNSEKQAYEDFCKRYAALSLAFVAYNENSHLNIPTGYEWLDSGPSYSEIASMTWLGYHTLSDHPPTASFSGTVYVTTLPEGFYDGGAIGTIVGRRDLTVTGGPNAKKTYEVWYSSSSSSVSTNYFQVIQDEIWKVNELNQEMDDKLQNARAWLAAQQKTRSDYIQSLQSDIRNYNTARSNYELARKAYLDAFKNMQNLLASLPDYVKDQYVFVYTPDTLWTYQDSYNPTLVKMLRNASNRPALVRQIGSQLKPYYDRYLRYNAQMKNAKESLRQYASAMDNFDDGFTNYMIFEPELGRDLGLMPVSLGEGVDWEGSIYYKPFVPNDYTLTNTYSITSEEWDYATALRLLYQDFNGVSKYQLEAKECAHLLRLNFAKIVRESNHGSMETFNAINTRYNKAASMARSYSWVGLGGSSGNVYEPYETLYNQIQNILLENRLPVRSIYKGGARSASLLDAPEYDLTLTSGGSGTLTVTVEPADAYDTTVVWTSRDPEVVSVDQNGRVTALTSGDTVIVAYPADSILVPVDTQGNILEISTGESTYGDPVVPTGAVFGGYTHVLEDGNNGYVSAEIEFTVHVADDPALGLWSRVRAYEGVYDGSGHTAVAVSGLEDSCVVEYSTDGGESWDLISPYIIDAGTMTVQVRLTPGTLPELPPDAESWDYTPPEPEEPGEPGEPAGLSDADGVQIKTFTARVGVLDLTGKEVEVVYGEQALVDGESHDVVIDSVSVGNVTVPAGSYTVASGGSAAAVSEQSVTITGSGNFTGTTKASAAKWRLRKPTPTASDLTFTAPAVQGYTGAPITVAAPTANKQGMGAVTVKYNGKASAPVDVGEYAITADVAEGAGFEEAYAIPLGTLTIGKGSWAGVRSFSYEFPLEVTEDGSSYDPNKDWYTFVFPRPVNAAIDESSITVTGDAGFVKESRAWTYNDDQYLQVKVNSTAVSSQATVTATMKGNDSCNYEDYALTFTVRSEGTPKNFSGIFDQGGYWMDGEEVGPGVTISCTGLQSDTTLRAVVGQYVGRELKDVRAVVVTLTQDKGYSCRMPLDFADLPGATYKLFLLDPETSAPLSSAQ